MRVLRFALLPGAIGLAVAAEWVTYRDGDLEVVVADAAVGLVLVTCGPRLGVERPRTAMIEHGVLSVYYD